MQAAGGRQRPPNFRVTDSDSEPWRRDLNLRVAGTSSYRAGEEPVRGLYSAAPGDSESPGRTGRGPLALGCLGDSAGVTVPVPTGHGAPTGSNFKLKGSLSLNSSRAESESESESESGTVTAAPRRWGPLRL